MEKHEALYKHLTLEGTPYEIGKKQAEFLVKHYPGYEQFMFQGNDNIKPRPKEAVKDTIRLLDEFCPNLNQEIKGFADYFNRTPEEVIYYSFSHVSHGNCGHFAVLSQKSADQNIYVGRSYEWSEEDDKLLLTIKEKGVYTHIGFSLLLFGRYDGINEKGLCVTMSNGIPCAMSEEEGLRFWMVIRILLDQCKNVKEAVDMVKLLPISSYCNLIITDQENHSVLVEIHNSIKTFQEITSDSSEGYVCSTNHYNLPPMLHLVKNKMQHSLDRYNAINNTLKGNLVDKEMIRKLLSTHTPNGLACHYYSEGLGTLWSVIYDVTHCTVEICFGSPLVNKWYTLDLATEEGVKTYDVVLPYEEADPKTWMRV